MTMYQCPRLVNVPVVMDLPTVMYKSPLFSVKSSLNKDAANSWQANPELSALENRQEAVIRRLESLKHQLEEIYSTRIKSTTTTATTTGIGAAATSSPIKSLHAPLQDLVISASPSSPPFSLLVLRHLLGSEGRPVLSTSRLHSSVQTVKRELREAFCDSPLGERSKHSLAFSLQWTNGTATPTLMINPLRQTKIEGEANILRYVSRLFPATSRYNYEASGTFSDIAEIDSLLDTLEKRLVWGCEKERKAGIIDTLATRLSRSSFLCGDVLTIADILAWSLLRQGRGQKQRSNDKVNKWMEKIDRLTGLDMNSLTTTPTPATTAPPAAVEGGKVSPPKPAEGKHFGRKELEVFLKGLEIPYKVKEHKAVLTVNELMTQVQDLQGVITKNLFLKDKKKKLYLLTTKHDATIDLKEVSKQVGTKELRLAEETLLLQTLGVSQGSVSPLALANDSTNSVHFLLQSSAIHPSVQAIHSHPLNNSATLGLKPQDLSRFLEAVNHVPTLVNLG